MGKTTTYSYNADTNMLEWVKYPNDTDATRTNYSYDSMYRLASAAVTTNTGDSLSADYTYENDLLTEIETASTTYSFSYGDFALRTAVKIGNRTLASYMYTDDRNYYLESLDYGNGDRVQYEYDNQGRVVKETYEDGDTVTYQYNNDGDLASVTDSATGITTAYYYDLSGRLMKYVESGGRSRTVTYTYDSKNNLTSVSDDYNGITSRYTYDEDNRVEAVSNGYSSIHYSYDSFGRVSQEQTKRGNPAVVTDSYTFRNPTSTTTSTQVGTHTIAASGLNATYTYTYDNNGNIASVSDGTYTTSYVYDSQNQLIRENNQKANKTWTWEYDGAGNILNRKEYSYTTGTLGTAASTKAYTYGDSEWGDLLTSYNGTAITYDDIGNMLTYGSKTFTWEHGRELAAIDDWQMTYTSDGMRLKRYNSSSGMFYTYYYRGDQLTGMLFYNDEIDGELLFYYDANGTILFAEYNIDDAINGNSDFGDFYYVTNLQGDVIALVDEDGNKLVEYTYDAWGCPLSTSYYSYGYDIAYYNPLRYRGYVYDVETGLYYLQSRYYDPEIGRFISADNQISGVGGEILGYNQFAYCFNNPVNLTDSAGNWPNWGKLFSGASLLAVGLMACAAAATVVTAGACAPLLAAACVTFVAGGMTVLNGTAEMVESVTDYNYMRDGVYGGDAEFYEAQKSVFETTAELGTAVIGMASNSPALCFVAGTMVLISEGAKVIEEIEAGDYVWAWDEKTGDVALKQVVETYVNETSELVHVFINGEEIVTTPSHPFYSPVKGWTDAIHLRAGDTLVLVNGEYVVVEKIQHEILEAPITVYNFQVADYHTYYVSDTGVLVHNSCGGETPATKRGREVHKGWDYGPGVEKEQIISSGARVDGIDRANNIIYELKPNNPRAISLGLRQLDRYLDIMGPENWAGVLVLYDP